MTHTQFAELRDRLDSLIAAQQETNRLLAQLLASGGAATPAEPAPAKPTPAPKRSRKKVQ